MAPKRWELVYSDVRDRILCLDLEPGAKVSEVGLAEKYGVSPTPVRDALGRLVQDGMLVTGGTRGYWVAPLSVRELQQLSDFRFVLERHVGESLLGNEQVDWERLEEASRSTPSTEKKAYIRANIEFHLLLAESAGNPFLTTSLRQVLERSSRYFWLGLPNAPEQPFADDHRALVEAMRQGEHERMERIYRSEVYGTRDRVRALLTQMISDPGSVEAGGQIPISLS